MTDKQYIKWVMEVANQEHAGKIDRLIRMIEYRENGGSKNVS